MDVRKAASRATTSGSSDNFTGNVWNEEIGVGDGPSRLHVAKITFAPAARTRWHTHSCGQVLLVMAGIGCIQKEGEPLRELLPGDSVVIAPNELHWHGAAPLSVFVHLAMQEPGPDGKQAMWLRPVTDDEYLRSTANLSCGVAPDA